MEGLIRGHDVDAAALNKSTNPGSQSKQQIGRVARAREAVDSMLKRWLVPARVCVCFIAKIGLERYNMTLTCAMHYLGARALGERFGEFELGQA